MVSLTEFLDDFSKNYSVQRFDDIESGIFVTKIKEDIYLMKNVEVKTHAEWIRRNTKSVNRTDWGV